MAQEGGSTSKSKWMDSVPKKDQKLLDRIYISLKANYQKAQMNYDNSQKYKMILGKIEVLLSTPKSWENAYHLQQIMIPLHEEAHLDIELKKMISKADQNLPYDLERRYYSLNIQEAKRSEKQAHLSHLLKELEIFYENRRKREQLIDKTNIRTGIVFVVSIFLFFLPYLLPEIARLMQAEEASKGSYILLSMSAGWMGAAFSMLLNLKTRLLKGSLNVLEMGARYSTILSRVFIGVGAGLILFYILQSGVILGDFVPVFNKEPLPLLDEKGQALLILWCFLSGFSEKLVPQLLTRVEKQTQSI